MSLKRRRHNECTLSYTDYVVELLMDKFKDMFATPKKRALLISHYLGNQGLNSAAFQVTGLYEQKAKRGETNSAKQERINRELFAYTKGLIEKYSPSKRYILSGIRDIPDPETDTTHFTGFVIDTRLRKVYYFDTAGGEYSANDVTTLAIQELAKALRSLGYTFVNETNVGETCQVVPADTFCQTWSAYYTIGRVLDPRFGKSLARHALSTRGNNARKIKELFTVFKKLTSHIPAVILDDLAVEYAKEVAEDDNIPAELKTLDGAQIQRILTAYFSDDSRKNEFVRLVEMPPIEDCERVINGSTLRGLKGIVKVKHSIRGGLRKTRKVRRA